MPKTETLRLSSDGQRQICKESCLAIIECGVTATERGLAAEVAASFALTDVVADLVRLPRDTPIPRLTDALIVFIATHIPQSH